MKSAQPSRDFLVVAALIVCMPLSTPAQGWKPEQPVELIVGCAPGCGPDNMARLMQRGTRIYSTRMFASATTLRQTTISFLIMSANASGVLV